MKPSTAVIIDDDVFSIRILDAALRGWRFNVVSTDRATNLAELLKTYRPALIIMNAAVPGLDIDAIVRFIRTDPELRAAIVLLQSSLDVNALWDRARHCGADGAIRKSPSVTDFEGQLEHWLSH
jgi:CheY-like chemotaxis protein